MNRCNRVRPDVKLPQATLFFDGVCNLCDGFVNFVADHDSEGRVRFGAIQLHRDKLELAGAGKYAEGGSEALSTVVLIQGNRVFTKSAAALRVVALLDEPWRYLAGPLFYLIPYIIRDWGYELVSNDATNWMLAALFSMKFCTAGRWLRTDMPSLGPLIRAEHQTHVSKLVFSLR